MIRAWTRDFARRLPARCEVCHAWPARAVCPHCARRFACPATRCPRCALPVPTGVAACGRCLREPPPLDACHAALGYAYPWDRLVARLKFQGEPGWAGPLADLMRADPGIAGALQAADLALPIPLGPQRLAQRGYNQALELARALAPRRLDARSLLRVADTPAQASLPRQERLDNMAGAFALDPLRIGRVRGRHVVLVDDVMTSGATLWAAARVLRQAGARRVEAVVLARTDDNAQAA